MLERVRETGQKVTEEYGGNREHKQAGRECEWNYPEFEGLDFVVSCYGTLCEARQAGGKGCGMWRFRLVLRRVWASVLVL